MTFTDFSGDDHAAVLGNVSIANVADYDHLIVEGAYDAMGRGTVLARNDDLPRSAHELR